MQKRYLLVAGALVLAMASYGGDCSQNWRKGRFTAPPPGKSTMLNWLTKRQEEIRALNPEKNSPIDIRNILYKDDADLPNEKDYPWIGQVKVWLRDELATNIVRIERHCNSKFSMQRLMRHIAGEANAAPSGELQVLITYVSKGSGGTMPNHRSAICAESPGKISVNNPGLVTFYGFFPNDDAAWPPEFLFNPPIDENPSPKYETDTTSADRHMVVNLNTLKAKLKKGQLTVQYNKVLWSTLPIEGCTDEQFEGPCSGGCCPYEHCAAVDCCLPKGASSKCQRCMPQSCSPPCTGDTTCVPHFERNPCDRSCDKKEKKCLKDEARCLSPETEQVCNNNGEWISNQCVAPSKCSDGRCRECEDETTRCDSPKILQVCINGKWIKKNCAKNLECSEGACTLICKSPKEECGDTGQCYDTNTQECCHKTSYRVCDKGKCAFNGCAP